MIPHIKDPFVGVPSFFSGFYRVSTTFFDVLFVKNDDASCTEFLPSFFSIGIIEFFPGLCRV